MDRLEQQMNFIKEVDKLKGINRQNPICDGSRSENDAEHSWHIALMCLILAEHANEEFDKLRVVSMLLIHDLVEIDAGDTYAYDDNGYNDKRAREERAADRLFNLLPSDQAVWMRDLWEEFEEGTTIEARFANAMDRTQPVLLNDESGGTSWISHDVCLDQIMKRQSATKDGSAILFDYINNIFKKNVEAGKIKPSALS